MDSDQDGLPDICEAEPRFWQRLTGIDGLQCPECVSWAGTVVKTASEHLNGAECKPDGLYFNDLESPYHYSCPQTNLFAAYYVGDFTSAFWMTHDVATNFATTVSSTDDLAGFHPDGKADCQASQLRFDNCPAPGPTTTPPVDFGPTRYCIWADATTNTALTAPIQYLCPNAELEGDNIAACASCEKLYYNGYPSTADGSCVAPIRCGDGSDSTFQACNPFGQNEDATTNTSGSGMSSGTAIAVGVGSSFVALLLLLVVILFFIRRGDKSTKFRQDRRLLAQNSASVEDS